VAQDSKIRRIDAAKSFGAWRSIGLRARDVLTRFGPVECDECLRLIHWWSRRVALVGPERCAHLQCWKGRLFLKEMVADEIRQLVIGGEARRPPGDGARTDYNGSDDNVLPESNASAASRRETAEKLDAQAQQLVECTAEMTTYKQYTNGYSSMRDLGRQLWHSLGRLAVHRAPCPPRLCMLCGGVEFSEASLFCSNCGTSLRPSG
jgi:hypothetical protein